MTAKLRLQWKTFLYLLGFCALLLAVLWLFQTVLLESFYKNIRVREIKSLAEIIADSMGDENIAEIIETASENHDVTADIVNADGKSILTEAPAPGFQLGADENKTLVSRAAGEGGEFYEYLSPTPPKQPAMDIARSAQPTAPLPGRFYARPVQTQSLIYVRQTGAESAIIIRAIISPVNATVQTLRYQLYVISAIMIFLSVILAVIIAKRVSKPIENISRSAKALAKGNYGVRFNGKGFKEILELSNTLNTAAAELGRVEGFRRELLANVSHDLRTPLALIYSYAEMMNDFPEEISREQTQVIMTEAKRLTALVNDVLDTSKMESDIERLNRSGFNLTENISETVRQLNELLKSEGFKISFEFDEDVNVTADKAKISRVFYNLLINAVNYSGESREITVRQTVSNNLVRVRVTDHGEGIAENELPYIWERYYKSGKTHKRAVAGSGLGLSIVKKIMDMHEGRYGVTSELGKGSTFWFELNSGLSRFQ